MVKEQLEKMLEKLSILSVGADILQESRELWQFIPTGGCSEILEGIEMMS